MKTVLFNLSMRCLYLGEKVLRSRILCVRYMPCQSTNDAICEIILLPRGTSSTPKDYTYVG